MKVTKQSTYSWDAAVNVSEKEAIAFANHILSSVSSNVSENKLKFEIAPWDTEVRTHWNNAVNYCNSLVVDGKTGWRLPTAAELQAIFDTYNDFDLSFYWSSEEFRGGGAYGHDFRFPGKDLSNKSMSRYVRAVRDL